MGPGPERGTNEKSKQTSRQISYLIKMVKIGQRSRMSDCYLKYEVRRLNRPQLALTIYGCLTVWMNKFYLELLSVLLIYVGLSLAYFALCSLSANSKNLINSKPNVKVLKHYS